MEFYMCFEADVDEKSVVLQKWPEYAHVTDVLRQRPQAHSPVKLCANRLQSMRTYSNSANK
jgi:hypothetical protein